MKQLGLRTLILGLLTLTTHLTLQDVQAQSDSSSSLHAGSVSIRDKKERKLFERLLCQCGDCARLPLSTCACGWAESRREQLRAQLQEGASVTHIQSEYRKEFGAKALAIPADEGLSRVLWALPLLALVLGGFALLRIGRKWSKRSKADTDTTKSPRTSAQVDAQLDAQLDAELDEMES